MYAGVMQNILILTALILSLLVSGPVAAAQLGGTPSGFDVSEARIELVQHQSKDMTFSTQSRASQCVHTCIGIDFLSFRPQFQRIGLLNAKEFFMKDAGFFKPEFPTPILGPPRFSA